MSKKTIVWLVIAVSLILIGVIIFVGVMSIIGWDFRKLETVEYVTISHEVTDDFRNILIDTDVSDIEFLPSEDGKTLVKCLNIKDTPHKVNVLDGTLKIELEQKVQNWYFGINFQTPKITVHMPKGEYDSIKVKNSTGDLDLPSDFKFGAVDVSLTTGDAKCYASASEKIKIKTTTGGIRLENLNAPQIDLSFTSGDSHIANIKCDNLVTDGTTGDIVFKNVLADKKFSATCSTGDISLYSCDAGELYLKTTTGDIEGSLLSNKVFVAKSTTGDIRVPQTSTGGKCEIDVTTGDIRIEIK